MSSKSSPKERAAVVMTLLRSHRHDRGAMSNLRCALNPTRRHRAWPLLARVGGIDDPATETIAGCYAHHPDETGEGNFGDTCRRLAGPHKTFEARFQRFLACDREELCDRLRPVVLAAKSRGIPINYEALLEDILWWGDRVRARWARAFWVGKEELDTTSTEAQ